MYIVFAMHVSGLARTIYIFKDILAWIKPGPTPFLLHAAMFVGTLRSVCKSRAVTNNHRSKIFLQQTVWEVCMGRTKQPREAQEPSPHPPPTYLHST